VKIDDTSITMTKATSNHTSRWQAVTWYLPPTAAVMLALAAIAAVYVISFRSSPHHEQERRHSLVEQAYPGISLTGAFPQEPGPDGQEWQWLGDTASMQVATLPPAWVAFRALSAHIARRLTLRSATGEETGVQIGTRPQIYMVGPLASGAFVLRSTPPATVASRRDHRRVSVFVSVLRTSPKPFAALPGQGFWPTEGLGRAGFNWLRNNGVIDVYAPSEPTGRVWLTFVAASLEQRRRLTAQSGHDKHQALVRVTEGLVKLGPFRLRGGRARIILRASPGPSRYGSDPRQLSVRVAQLTAGTSASKA
jgi:hypothetical protein